MSCSAEEIAEKKRLALERLKQTKISETNSPNSNQCMAFAKPASKAVNPTASFYGSSINSKTNELTNYENKIKNQKPFKNNNRILSQPYPTKEQSSSLGERGKGNISAAINCASNSAMKKANTNDKVASVFRKIVTCTCEMIAENRFQVIQSGFHQKLIDMFKTIPTRKYGE